MEGLRCKGLGPWVGGLSALARAIRLGCYADFCTKVAVRSLDNTGESPVNTASGH